MVTTCVSMNSSEHTSVNTNYEVLTEKLYKISYYCMIELARLQALLRGSLLLRNTEHRGSHKVEVVQISKYQ